MKITKKNITRKGILFFLSIILVAFFGFVFLKSPRFASAGTLWEMQKESGIGQVGQTAFGGETPQDVRLILASIIKVFLGMMGIVFLIMLVWGGYRYMISRGNEEKVSEALSQIKNAVIGITIIAASWAITSYVTDCVLDVTKDTIWMCR